MALRDLTSPEAVIAAIQEFDQLGRGVFLQKYGFGESRAYYVVHNGKRYDSKAIAGAAHGFQFPDQGPLQHHEFSGGADGAASQLRTLGFDVQADETPGQIAVRFRDLAVASIAGSGLPAPHKPLLALIMLRRLKDGHDRLVSPVELAEELLPLLRRALPTVQQPSAWEPIWRFEDSLWEVVDVNGEIRPRATSKGDPNVAELRRPDVSCGLLEHVFEMLKENPSWRRKIEGDLVSRYLSSVPKDVIAAATGQSPNGRRYWWVNQGHTYAPERSGGFIWAPQQSKSAFSIGHHTAVGDVRRGDIILHYAKGSLRAIGVATADGRPHERPNELSGEQWEHAGLLAEIEYHDIVEPIALAEIDETKRISTGGPFTTKGAVKQGYLFELPSKFYKEFSMDFAQRLPLVDTEPANEQILCVYVGQSSEANLHHSRADGIWGWKEHQPDYDEVRPGDVVLLAVGFTGGSPRTSNEQFGQFEFRELIVGRVTQPVEEFSEPYWPDEVGGVVYPFRLKFEEIEARTNVPIADLDDEFGGPVADALRRSAIAQQRGILISTTHPAPPPADPKTLADVVQQFAADLASVGYRFGADGHDELVRIFVTSLATKRFLILTGLSGSGKTKLAQLFGQWLGDGCSQIVAVRPDWTSPDPLLGYENSLSEHTADGYAWQVPTALGFMLSAASQPMKPHVLLLDEMNLAHVERYFADVLSGMESRHPILPNLERSDGQWRCSTTRPDRIPLPANLFVIGTVNVDETTYMFSPKVLDRANTMEFRVSTADLQHETRGVDELPTASPQLMAAFLQASQQPVTIGAALQPVEAGLRELHGLLSEFDREFGHRTFAEALRFSALLSLAGEADVLTALDIQVLQKVLPKFHGSIRELADPMTRLATWCFFGPGVAPAADFDPSKHVTDTPALPRSFSKAARMLRRLRANHFVSFTE